MRSKNLKNSITTLGSLSFLLGSTLIASDLPSEDNNNEVRQEVQGPAMQDVNSDDGQNGSSSWQAYEWKTSYPLEDGNSSSHQQKIIAAELPSESEKSDIEQELKGPAMQSAAPDASNGSYQNSGLNQRQNGSSSTQPPPIDKGVEEQLKGPAMQSAAPDTSEKKADQTSDRGRDENQLEQKKINGQKIHSVSVEDEEAPEPGEVKAHSGKHKVNAADEEAPEPGEVKAHPGKHKASVAEDEEAPEPGEVKAHPGKPKANTADEEVPEPGEVKAHPGKHKASVAEDEEAPEPGEVKAHSGKPKANTADEEAPEPGETDKKTSTEDEEAPEPGEVKKAGKKKASAADEEAPEAGEKDAQKADAGGDEEAPEPGEKKGKKKAGAAEGEEGGGGNGKEKDEDSMINKYVDFGGALEVEAFYGSFDKDTKRSFSDIVLETAELDFEIKLVDWATGLLSIEWEPNDIRDKRRSIADRIIVKEGFITLGATKKCPPYVRAGRLFVPFTIGTGAVVGDTLSVSDPLTIEIFETREDVIMVGTSWGHFQVAAYVFNGDTHRRRFPEDPCNEDINDPDLFDDPGHIQQFGATIRYGWEKPDDSFSLGLDFLSDVFDSDNLSDAFGEALFASNYSPGIAAHMRYFKYGISFIAEVDITFNKTKFRMEKDKQRFEYYECIPRFRRFNLAPMAWMVELGYVTTICCKKTYFAIDYSRSYDVDGEFPKHRFLATIGSWLYEDKVLLAIEYGRDIEYPKSEGGSGRTIDKFVAQLAYEW